MPSKSSVTTVGESGERRPAPQQHALFLLLGRMERDGRVVPLGAEPLVLGRGTDEPGQAGLDEPPRLGLDDPRVSRRHAQIDWSETNRRYWIRDLGSRNGVHLNGVRVAREPLKPGDLIRLGNTVFRFRVWPAEERQGRLEPPFVGASPSLRSSVDRAARAALSDAPVLILGPTGTGKELVAEFIHRASGRPGPFVAVNCAALPAHLVESELFGHERGSFSGAEVSRPGLFRSAQRGTLFLDEVGELPAPVQAKFLRALECRSVRAVGAIAEASIDVRVISATNRDLAAEVAKGGFRADLYARLGEMVVTLDPLRERPEDLEPLWRHFVAELGEGAEVELGGAAFEAMALYAWPFNVRELRQLVRQALLVARDRALAVSDLPEGMQRPACVAPCAAEPALAAPGEAPSTRQLRRLVEEHQGNVKDVAAYLGKDRKQVYRWLRRYQIDPDVYRKSGD